MIGRASLLSTLALALAFVPAPLAAQPDPGAVARRCINAIQEAASSQAEANEAAARRCVRQINAFLANGQTTEARQLARRCIDHIETSSQESARGIAATTRQCVQVLLRLNEPRLARRVAEAGERGINVVRRSARVARRAILNALAS